MRSACRLCSKVRDTAKPGFDLDISRRNKPREFRAELAARDQLVVGAAAKRFGGLSPRMSQMTAVLGGSFLSTQIDQRADRGMAAADDRDTVCRRSGSARRPSTSGMA